MVKMKIAFLVFHGIDVSGAGIGLKIRAQVEALQKSGCSTSLSYLSTDSCNQYDGRLMDGKLMERFESKWRIDKRFHWRFRFNALLAYLVSNEFNGVYIRYTHFANPFFNRFLKRLNKHGIVVLLEIPTYPYDAEYSEAPFFKRLNQLTERFFRMSLRKNVYRVVTVSDDDFIFGIPTIKISNGVNVDDLPLVEKRKTATELNLIAVASMQFWHGYDRLIEGLRNYYQGEWKVKVVLRLVGDTRNPESLKYKKLIKNYKLNEYVQLYETRNGGELDALFDQSDIGVGCLGLHRKLMDHAKSLKNVEYCARGIPFLYSEMDDRFDGEPFVFKAIADESPIDIHRLIAFNESVSTSPAEIRSCAAEQYTWVKQMKKVIDALEC